MTADAFGDALWQLHQTPDDPGVGLEDEDLTLDAGHRAQIVLLNRWLAEGESVGGWKIGMTSGANRNAMGDGVRPFGFILASRILHSGASLPLSRLYTGQIENELCLILGAPLGAGTSRAEALAAVTSIAPAFEINQKRLPKGASAGLRVADDLSNWGIVVGTPVPCNAPALDDMQVTLSRGTHIIESVNSRGHIDDPFDSLATLANTLATYDLELQSGQHVITGAYGKTPFAPGRFTGEFDCNVGSVTVELVDA